MIRVDVFLCRVVVQKVSMAISQETLEKENQQIVSLAEKKEKQIYTRSLSHTITNHVGNKR